MYSVYCTNYPNALKFTQTMQKQKPQFQNFCRVRRQPPFIVIFIVIFIFIII